MKKIAIVSTLAALMSFSVVAGVQATEHHSPRSVKRVDRTSTAANDFQALAAVNGANRSIVGRDSLDYHLGYFRNF